MFTSKMRLDKKLSQLPRYRLNLLNVATMNLFEVTSLEERKRLDKKKLNLDLAKTTKDINSLVYFKTRYTNREA